MKKFNKVTTVKMAVDAEVLPLNVTFVARMMDTKQVVDNVINMLEDSDDKLTEEARQWLIEDVKPFFSELYESMVSDN